MPTNGMTPPSPCPKLSKKTSHSEHPEELHPQRSQMLRWLLDGEIGGQKEREVRTPLKLSTVEQKRKPQANCSPISKKKGIHELATKAAGLVTKAEGTVQEASSAVERAKSAAGAAGNADARAEALEGLAGAEAELDAAKRALDAARGEQDTENEETDEQTATRRVNAYLGPLFTHARSCMGDIDISSTPLFLLATAGMRRLEETNSDGYNILIGAIKRRIEGAGFPRDKIEYKVITGEDEAVYGWVTANYSSKRFDKLWERTYGFVEMGGESLQIAFRPTEDERNDYTGNLTQVKMAWGGKTRSFYLFAKTWLGLGIGGAWRKHLENIRNNPSKVSDPCVPTGYRFKVDNRDIRGACDYGEALAAAKKLLPCTNPDCRRGLSCRRMGKSCLLMDAPSLGFDDSRRHFVGGSMYWHATKNVFGNERTSYNYMDFQTAISRFGWKHWKDIKRDNIAGGLAPEKKALAEKRLQIAFFAAVLVVSTLYVGFGLPRSAETSDESADPGSFQPFDGVEVEGVRVPYSWTLGRVVLYATGDFKPQVRSRAQWSAE